MMIENSDFNRWDGLIRKYSHIHEVPWRWVKAVMINESNLGRAPSVARGLSMPSDVVGSRSSDGKSWGLMQLTLNTARMFESSVTEVALNDPETSIRLGVKYLKWLIVRSGLKNRERIIRGYNGGLGYMNTLKGAAMTEAYYKRFEKNLAEVMRLNQGNELEY